MKLSKLLSQRPALLRQVRLANLAFAYQALCDFAARVQRAQLSGLVTLRPANLEEERYLPTLTALEYSQAVVDEHFTEEDVMLLNDVVAFATGHPNMELTFHLESLESDFIGPLRNELRRLGIEPEETLALPSPNETPQSDHSAA